VVDVITHSFAKLRGLTAAAISPLSGLRTERGFKMDDDRITSLFHALVARFDAEGPERAVENLEALIDAMEKARYQGVCGDFIEAFLENIGRKVSPEIQRALAAGRPKLVDNQPTRSTKHWASEELLGPLSFLSGNRGDPLGHTFQPGRHSRMGWG
jgi:hypothetical protein